MATTLKQRAEQYAKEGRLLGHLIELQKRGNIAPVVTNPCPRKATCMAELTMMQIYEGRGRKMVVPAGHNPFKS